jgi:gamma-glutamyl-gamma-aminobutyrate hydrolase PuuD
MAKNIIGIINPKDEIPKEYIKLLLKNEIQYEIFRDGKNFSKYSGFLVVGNKNFNENEINLDIFSYAEKINIPVLCIGWGMQVLNYYYGGKIESKPKLENKSNNIKHRIFLVPGSKTSFTIGGSGWVSILESKSRSITNKSISSDLFVSAYNRELKIEGLERPGHLWILGVQWHLYDKNVMPSGFENIFLSFLDRSTE